MANRGKKLTNSVTLFAQIERETKENLRMIAFRQRKSIAQVVRDALDAYMRTIAFRQRKPVAQVAREVLDRLNAPVRIKNRFLKKKK